MDSGAPQYTLLGGKCVLNSHCIVLLYKFIPKHRNTQMITKVQQIPLYYAYINILLLNYEYKL